MPFLKAIIYSITFIQNDILKAVREKRGKYCYRIPLNTLTRTTKRLFIVTNTPSRKNKIDKYFFITIFKQFMTCLTVCCNMSMTKQETQKCPLSQNFNKSLYHPLVS